MYDPSLEPGDPYVYKYVGSPLKNHQLPRLIHDVLNTIAKQAIELGAIYANTDGYIAPSPTIADCIQGLITDWGLVGRIKAEGDGRVKAGGTYQVGASRTLNYSRTDTQITDRIYPPSYADWLMKSFTFFAAKRNET